jgi:hypothetical protein
MFIAKRKVPRKKKIMIYYVLVESEYKNNKPRQKVLRYLGTAEKIKDVFDKYAKKRKRR